MHSLSVFKKQHIYQKSNIILCENIFIYFLFPFLKFLSENDISPILTPFSPCEIFFTRCTIMNQINTIIYFVRAAAEGIIITQLIY